MSIFGKKENQGTGYNDAPKETNSDPFSRVGSAEVKEGAGYPIAGAYPILFVDCMKMIKNRKGDDVFIAQFEILESNVPERPAGTKMDWAANFKHDPTPGNVRAFQAAVMGVNADEVGADDSRFMCSEKNPTHGRLVRMEAKTIKTQRDTDFTLCQFSSVNDELQAQAKELREKAGFAPF